MPMKVAIDELKDSKGWRQVVYCPGHGGWILLAECQKCEMFHYATNHVDGTVLCGFIARGR